jgi:hypothetical protein
MKPYPYHLPYSNQTKSPSIHQTTFLELASYSSSPPSVTQHAISHSNNQLLSHQPLVNQAAFASITQYRSPLPWASLSEPLCFLSLRNHPPSRYVAGTSPSHPPRAPRLPPALLTLLPLLRRARRRPRGRARRRLARALPCPARPGRRAAPAPAAAAAAPVLIVRVAGVGVAVAVSPGAGFVSVVLAQPGLDGRDGEEQASRGEEYRIAAPLSHATHVLFFMYASRWFMQKCIWVSQWRTPKLLHLQLPG